MTKRGWTIAVAGAVLLALSGCDLLGDGDDGDGGEPPELTGKLVFSAEAGDEYHLFAMNADGTERQQMTFADEPNTGDTEPAWSPDGKQVAFATSRQATTLGTSLYLMNADGSNLRPLKRYERDTPPHVLVGSNPAWSPDGSQIAYDACVNCELGGRNYDIATVKVAGANYDPEEHHAVTDHPAADHFPTWSPDSEQIAFVSNRAYLQSDDPSRQDLYVADADGSNLRRLTETGNVGALAWKPNGKTIAYTLDGPGTNVFFLNIDSGKVSPLDIKLPDGLKLFPIGWSPDGRKLLLSALDYPNYSLHVLDMETRKMRRVPFGPEQLLGADWFVETKE